MSAEGGVFYIGSTANAVKVFVAGGVQDVAKSKAITTGMPAGAETIVQPVSSSLDDDEILLRNRSKQNFYYWNGEKYVAYSAPWKANSTCGGDAFKLNGTLYTIEPSGTNYMLMALLLWIVAQTRLLLRMKQNLQLRQESLTEIH